MIVLLLAFLAHGPAAYDLNFQQEQAARTAYAACLFRENDRRRMSGKTNLADFGQSCSAERNEIARVDGIAARGADQIAAGLKGFEDTLREKLEAFNKLYPAKK